MSPPPVLSTPLDIDRSLLIEKSDFDGKVRTEWIGDRPNRRRKGKKEALLGDRNEAASRQRKMW
ncbi:hypothetical protein BHM03_00044832 [Ensete ventricosum]|nr:hypothetical protein BHM03_00044832 [Ensete ventricosum]